MKTAFSGVWYNDKSSPSTADPLAVTNGPTAGIDATMVVGGQITGTFTDSSGAGISSICVSVSPSGHATYVPGSTGQAA